MMSKSESLVRSPDSVPDEAPPKVFAEFLENQSREIEIRAREMELEKQRDDRRFEFAKRALEAQIQDSREQRDFHLKAMRSAYVFTILAGIVFVGLLVTALALNKDQVALEIIKAVIFVATGGAGGYALGKQRTTSTSSGGAPTDKGKPE